MKKTEKNKTDVQDFVDTMKDNPKKIIAWAEREIVAYKELIAIIEKTIKAKK